MKVLNKILKRTLETPLLVWNRKEDKIYNDTTVRITTPYQVIRGIGIIGNHDFSEYVIKDLTTEGFDFSED